MKPGIKKVPSIFCIQERHVRHGEKFKVFKVSSRRRREYIAKFLSPRLVTYSSKSRKVSMGCGWKETTYKGRPLSKSRLLQINPIQDAYTTLEELQKKDVNPANANQPDSNSPFLSYSSDRRTLQDQASTSELPGPSNDVDGSVPQPKQKLLDFNLIFGSDTNEAEDSDSDNDDQEDISVEITLDPRTVVFNQQIGEATENQRDKNILVSLERMENQIKKIVNVFEAAQNTNSSNQSNGEIMALNPQLPRNNLDPRPSLCVPPNPPPMRRSQTGPHPSRFLGEIQPPNPARVPRDQQWRWAPSSTGNGPVPSFNAQEVNRASLGVGGSQIRPGNPNPSQTSSGITEPSGSIPFFRVPGGCFMVIHATNQTTPFLHATFVTGCTNGQQFQQMRLPVYGAHQIVAVHLGPYRLRREEIDGIFAFANSTKAHDTCNPP